MNLKALKSLFSQTITERDVYYFSTEKINTDDPHYFICIKKSDTDVLIFSCGTTQWEKRLNYIQKKGLSTNTLVYIDPAKAGADFKKETYIDCNKYIPFTVDEFDKHCRDKGIEYKGVLDEDYYEQILIGLHSSTEIEDAIKEILPKPQ
jgi:hypothetical protein